MNLLKKSFVGISILLLFILGILIFPNNKADATIAVDVRANGVANYLTVNSGTLVTITWDAPAATSCTNNFNSSTAKNSSFTYTATATKTFTVNCSTPAYCSGTYTVIGGYCQGGTVAGSKDGTTIPGPYEGQLCSSLTKSVCDTGGWITHGCSTWLATTSTASCVGLSQASCLLHSSGTPHCTWNP